MTLTFIRHSIRFRENLVFSLLRECLLPKLKHRSTRRLTVPLLSVTLCSWNVSAQCLAPSQPVGTYTAMWDSPTGKYYTLLKLTSTSTGFVGTYGEGPNAGTVIGHFANAQHTTITGTWSRLHGNSGGACSYGRFVFHTNGHDYGELDGMWSYCNASPQWAWTNSLQCNDTAKHGVGN